MITDRSKLCTKQAFKVIRMLRNICEGDENLVSMILAEATCRHLRHMDLRVVEKKA